MIRRNGMEGKKFVYRQWRKSGPQPLRLSISRKREKERADAVLTKSQGVRTRWCRVRGVRGLGLSGMLHPYRILRPCQTPSFTISKRILLRFEAPQGRLRSVLRCGYKAHPRAQVSARGGLRGMHMTRAEPSDGGVVRTFRPSRAPSCGIAPWILYCLEAPQGRLRSVRMLGTRLARVRKSLPAEACAEPTGLGPSPATEVWFEPLARAGPRR